MRGGTRQGAGRKIGYTKENPRNIIKQVRWTAAEWAGIKIAAELYSMTPSEFIRWAAAAEAEED